MLDRLHMRQALEARASKLPAGTPAEMAIIGGGAGMMSQLFPESRSTADLDVLDVSPPEVLDLCCYHAPSVAKALQLSPAWFDATPVTMRHMMLPGWRDRAVEVGTFGSLRVKAIGRIDLIALKMIAGRQRDIIDLGLLAVTREEADRVEALLPQLAEQGANPDLIEAAIAVARSWDRPDA